MRKGVHPAFPLQPLTSYDIAYDLDRHSHTFHVGGDRAVRNSWQDASNWLRNPKQSRELLLPISGYTHSRSCSSSTTHRPKPPSLARTVVEKNAAPPHCRASPLPCLLVAVSSCSSSPPLPAYHHLPCFPFPPLLTSYIHPEHPFVMLSLFSCELVLPCDSSGSL